uniref:Protein kinase domain-containing protein n=1 Tax=Anabas testudineus TaxID=64144 RepID=A0A3Q1I6C2_ANATE
METGLGPSQVKENDILHSDSTSYQILNFNGEGCFGKIAKCRNLGTGNIEAVKILKFDLIECEVEMLEAIRTLDPDKTNIVRFMESFQFQNLSCLVFEMLDRSLLDLIKERKGNPMNLNEIRPGLGIMHADLKPDNVMLVNHRDQPFRIKLTDFGLALPENAVEPGMFIQICAYRAPEVSLGLLLSTAADMWSVGCIMAYMYPGRNLFPNNCEHNWMKVMLHLLGQPNHWQLGSGIYTSDYFTWENDSKDPLWRFKTPEEYEETTGIKSKMKCKFSWLVKDLEDALHRCTTDGDPTELKDREVFLSLLKRCLHVNSEGRITPSEAMTHSFITMVHLVEDRETSIYADAAFQLMTALKEPISTVALKESRRRLYSEEPVNSSAESSLTTRTDSFLTHFSQTPCRGLVKMNFIINHLLERTNG